MRRPFLSLFHYFQYVAHRFFEERCLLWAGMLTYVSLLALVPFLVVVLSIVSAFPVFEQWAGQVETFILQNFVPATGSVAREYLAEFVLRAKDLSLLGIAFLIVTALLLMFSIDTIVNQLWRVDKSRTLGNKFLVYWAAMTVGPIMMGSGIVLSASVAPTLERTIVDAGLQLFVTRALPLAISTLAFSLIYYFVPNVRVRVLHATSGGFLAALLFEAAKSGFALYLREFPAYEAIYGAFAVVPIFLVWTYLSWTVLLLGASLTSGFGSYARAKPKGAWREGDELPLVYRMLRHLWDAQRRGEAITFDEMLEREPAADDAGVARVLGKLSHAGLVRRDEVGRFRLIRDLGELTLLDLWRSVPLAVPVRPTDGDAELAWPVPLSRALAELKVPFENALARPLEVFFEESAHADQRTNAGPAALVGGQRQRGGVVKDA